MMLTTGFLQFTPRFGEPERNRERVRDLTSGATFDLLVLPELCTSGYQFATRDEVYELSEPAEGELTALLTEIAAQAGGVVVAGFAERVETGVYNSAMTVGPKGLLSVYRKIHLYAREAEWFVPGDRPFAALDAGLPVPIGVMICFDWIFPESGRSLALDGARIIAHPSNLVMPYCQKAMYARAVENRIFIITANRCGTEERGGQEPLTFTGGSQIMGPDGTVLGRAGEQEDRLVLVHIDPAEAHPQLNRHNHLYQDRRPDKYRL